MIDSMVLVRDSEGFWKVAESVARTYGIAVLEREEREEGRTPEGGGDPGPAGDGVLFFTEDPDTERVEALRRMARDENRSWLSLPPDEDAIHPLAARARDWLYESGVTCLAVSGDVPGSRFPVCRDILKALFAMCLLRTRPERLHEMLSSRSGEREKTGHPDVASVVADLEARLSLKDRVGLARFEGEARALQDSALAVYILGHYLWPPNFPLLADCARRAGCEPEAMDENGALAILLEALLKEVRKSCLLRVLPGGTKEGRGEGG